MIAEAGCCFSKSNDFGVGGRIVVRQITVEAASDKLSIFDYYGTDRYFTSRESESRLLKRKLHPFRIIAGQSGTVIFRGKRHSWSAGRLPSEILTVQLWLRPGFQLCFNAWNESTQLYLLLSNPTRS